MANINNVMSSLFIRNAYVNSVSNILSGTAINEANADQHIIKQEQALMKLSIQSNPTAHKSSYITFIPRSNVLGSIPKTHSEITGPLTGDTYVVNRSENWCKNWQDPDLQ